MESTVLRSLQRREKILGAQGGGSEGPCGEQMQAIADKVLSMLYCDTELDGCYNAKLD